jgi:outer membrane protein assembly factor BamB
VETKGIVEPPAMDGSRVYLLDGNGWLYAIERDTGKVLWKRVVDSEGPNQRPILADDGIVIHVGEKSIAYSGTSGDELWFHTEGEMPTGAISSTEDTLLLLNPKGRLSSLDSRTGKRKWTCSIELLPPIESDDPSIQVCRGVAVCLFGGSVFGVSMNTGRLMWSRSLGGVANGWVASGEDYVIVVLADGSCVRIDPQSGSQIWVSRVEGSRFPFSRPVVDKGRIYFGSGDGRIHVLGLRDGYKIQTFDFPVGGSSLGPSLLICNGHLVIWSLATPICIFKVDRADPER